MSNPAEAARAARNAAASSSHDAGNQPLRLHQRCELSTYGQGEILFVGQTSFSHGIWVGIALDEAIGKHDGVVQGKRYFTAHVGHGIFVRSSQVHVLPDMEEEEQPDEEELEGEGETEVAAPVLTRPPRTTNRIPASRSGQVLSRSSLASTSRSVSPNKSTVRISRPSSILAPPTSSSAASAFGTGPRQQAESPQKRSSLAPKTPARTSTAGTASGRVSAVASRSTAASPVKRPVSSATSNTRTPATAARTGTTTTASRTPATSQRTALTQARSAVQAGRAPDAATARAGLRPVTKTRTSMAPPGTSSSALNPRTPARTAATASARVPQSTVAKRAVGTASSTPVSSASRATPLNRTPKTTGTSSSSRSSRPPTSFDVESREVDEEDDLMALSIEDAEGRVNKQIDKKQSTNDEEMDEGILSSPSLQRASTSQPHDHMSLSRGASSHTLAIRPNMDHSALQRELDEVRAKLRIAEKKRDEDRETIREAERIQQESEQFLAVKPKMAAKQQELQNELKDLHRQEREWSKEKEEHEREMAELTDQVEILTLDKEMAEERAEAAAEELQILKDRVEELQLDVEVLREENARFESGPVEEGEKLSVGYIQLEKQNERLKEALVRLRDLTGESDNEQKQKIAAMEKELRELDEVQASYESTLAKLQESEALLEDLKIQLDDALGAEEMLEQLTERNMTLQEKNEELRLALEHLETLKEVNDELEEAHIETEKQLQEESDLKDIQLREYLLLNESLKADIVDYVNAMSQYREAALNLQSENEALRNDEKTRDIDRAAVAAEGQAIANLNMKLQSSTMKSRAKTIELEIGRLEASQAKRHLSITSVYLPKKYFEDDKDAVESLLFFQRIATKTEVIKSIVESSTDIAGSLVGVIDERLITVCRMRHSLAHFIASSRQISALVQLASIPTFLKSGRMFKELVSIERKIDQYIDLLRREELKEDDCAKDYRRFVKMLEDFEFALLDGSSEAIDSDLAAKELGSATLFDLDLDTIAAALGFSKQAIASLYNDFNKQLEKQQKQASDEDTSTVVPSGEIDMRLNELDISEVLFTPLQNIINQTRSTKVPARKLLRRLAALYDNDEAVKMEAIIKLPGLGQCSSQLVAFASMLATSFDEYVSNVRTNKSPFELKDVLELVSEAVKEAMGSSISEDESGQVGISLAARAAAAWKPSLTETTNLGQTVTELLNASTEQDNVHKISGTAPWFGRVEELRQEQDNNAESQRTILKQTEDLRDLYKQIKVRDEVIEENRIKIERVSKQLQRSRQDNETVTSIRDDLVDMTKRMKAYEEGNSALQQELEQLQVQYEKAVNDNARNTVGEGASADPSSKDGGELGDAPSITPSGFLSGNYEVSYLVDQIEALRGAVRYLRLENGLIKGRDLIAQVQQLPTLAPRLELREMGQNMEGVAPIQEPSQLGLPRSRKEGRIEGLGKSTGKSASDARKQAENKRLVQDWIQMASCPRVITLPRLPIQDDATKDGEEVQKKNRKPWMPLAQFPHFQFDEMIRQRKRLKARIEELQRKGQPNQYSNLIAKPSATTPIRT